MNQKLIYDLPTRIFHWTFAALFIFCFFIAKTIDDDSPIFYWHMLAGILLSFLVFLRIIWGMIGTRYARFSSFKLNPKDLFRYLTEILMGMGKKDVGHNPASSWAAIIMMTCALGLGASGYMMTAFNMGEQFEDLHELFGNIFLLTAGLHVIGVIFHSLRFKDQLALSMIHGKKSDLDLPCDKSTEAIDQKTKVALILIAILLSFALYLSKNFDSSTNSLEIFGTRLQLGEIESED
jgi:cytochrome b